MITPSFSPIVLPTFPAWRLTLLGGDEYYLATFNIDKMTAHQMADTLAAQGIRIGAMTTVRRLGPISMLIGGE